MPERFSVPLPQSIVGELIVALRECLAEALEMNRRDALESAEQDYTEEPITL